MVLDPSQEFDPLAVPVTATVVPPAIHVVDPATDPAVRATLQAHPYVPPAVAPAREEQAPDRPRPLGRRSADDWYTLFGSMAASLGLVWLLYFKILPFSGKVGFVVCWYLAFVGFYAGLTALNHGKTIVIDRIASAAVHGAAALVALALGSTLLYTFVKGWPAIHHWNFFTKDMSTAAATSPLNQGGVLHALVGSGVELAIAVAVSMPLGLLTAVYLTEVGGRLAVAVRTVIEAMTALPDLVAGLFIYAILIVGLRQPRTGLAAALAICITMTPIIARSAEVVLRSVPSGLREASAALGAPQWRSVLSVILPTARAGLGTALILGMARGVGETAPVLITSSASSYFNANPFHEPMNSLPLFIYTSLRTTGGQKEAIARAYGAASLLLAFILVLFVFVRLLARERPGR
jgi:phosphate transport system permease protein